MNLVIISGRLGAAPEIKFLQNGTCVCELRVATSEVYYDKDNNRHEDTEWHSATIFGKPAENAGKYLEKGQMVTFQGRLKTRSWDLKIAYPDGKPVKGYKTSIIVSHVEYGTKARNTGTDAGEATQTMQAGPHPVTQGVPQGAVSAVGTGEAGYIDVAEDDIPF